MDQRKDRLSLKGSDLESLQHWKSQPKQPRQPHGTAALPNYQNNGMPGPKIQPPIKAAQPPMKPKQVPADSLYGANMNMNLGSLEQDTALSTDPYKLTVNAARSNTRVNLPHIAGTYENPEDAKVSEPYMPRMYGGLEVSKVPFGSQPPDWARKNYEKRNLSEGEINNEWNKELSALRGTVPEEQYNTYLNRAMSGRTAMSPRQATQYFNTTDGHKITPKGIAEKYKINDSKWEASINWMKEYIPQEYVQKYINAAHQGKHVMSARDAVNYYNKNIATVPKGIEEKYGIDDNKWKGNIKWMEDRLPSEYVQNYVNSAHEGKHTLSARDAANYYNKNKNAQSQIAQDPVLSGMTRADIEMSHSQERTAAGSPVTASGWKDRQQQRVYDWEKQHGPISDWKSGLTPEEVTQRQAEIDATTKLNYDASDYMQKTDMYANDAKSRADRADQQLSEMRRDDPGTRYARIYGTPSTETSRAEAGAINSLAAKEAAVKQKNLDEYNQRFGQWEQNRDAKYAAQNEYLGIQEPRKAQSEIAKLTAQVQNRQRAGTPISLKELVQAKINSNEMQVDSDVPKLLTALHGYDFYSPGSAPESEKIDKLYSDANADFDSYAQGIRKDRTESKAKAQETAQARGQRMAQLVNRGYTPAQAAMVVDQKKDQQGSNLNIDEMARGLAMAGVPISQAYEMASKYYSDEMSRRDANQERLYKDRAESERIKNEEADAERMYKLKEREVKSAENQAAQLHYEQTLKMYSDPTTGAPPKAGTREAASANQAIAAYNAINGTNLPPIVPDQPEAQQAAAAQPTNATQPNQAAQPQQQPLRDASVNRWEQKISETVNPDQPGGFRSAVRQLGTTDLTMDEKREVLARVFGNEFADPGEAEKKLSEIFDEVVEEAKKAGEDGAGIIASGSDDAMAASRNHMETNKAAIELLKSSIRPETYKRMVRDLQSKQFKAYTSSGPMAQNILNVPLAYPILLTNTLIQEGIKEGWLDSE